MSSGEADSYTVTLSNNTTYPNNDTNPFGITYPNYSTFSLTTPVYYYQVTCPRCKHLNWAEVDKIVSCKGKRCGATIKAVFEIVEYEIAVVKP